MQTVISLFDLVKELTWILTSVDYREVLDREGSQEMQIYISTYVRECICDGLKCKKEIQNERNNPKTDNLVCCCCCFLF